MKEYTVTLNMISDISIEQDKVAAILKGKKASISKREISGGILWCVESSLGKDMSIHEQIKELAEVFNLKQLNTDLGLFRKVYIDIAVFYDTYTCSISLSKSHIKTIIKFFPFVDIEIACYPTDFAD